jgi:hypothetical protein
MIKYNDIDFRPGFLCNGGVMESETIRQVTVRSATFTYYGLSWQKLSSQLNHDDVDVPYIEVFGV